MNYGKTQTPWRDLKILAALAIAKDAMDVSRVSILSGVPRSYVESHIKTMVWARAVQAVGSDFCLGEVGAVWLLDPDATAILSKLPPPLGQDLEAEPDVAGLDSFAMRFSHLLPRIFGKWDYFRKRGVLGLHRRLLLEAIHSLYVNQTMKFWDLPSSMEELDQMKREYPDLNFDPPAHGKTEEELLNEMFNVLFHELRLCYEPDRWYTLPKGMLRLMNQPLNRDTKERARDTKLDVAGPETWEEERVGCLNRWLGACIEDDDLCRLPHLEFMLRWHVKALRKLLKQAEQMLNAI